MEGQGLLTVPHSEDQRERRTSRVKKKSVAPVYTPFPQLNDPSSTSEEEGSDPSSSMTSKGSAERKVWRRRNQYLAAAAANMGALALGTVLSWPAVALPDLRRDPLLGGANLTIDGESWIGSIVALGAVAAGPAGGVAIEWVGRKGAMLLLSIPFFISWLLIHFATSLELILVGRFLTGFFAGTFAVAAPIFTGEVTDAAIRGAVGSTFDMMISLGILFIYVVGAFVGWRASSLVCGAIPLGIFVLMLFVPESPAFFLKKGRRDEALKALAAYRALPVGSPDLEDEITEMETVAALNSSNSSKTPWTRREVIVPVAIGFTLYMFQVLSGLDPVLVYTVDIFAEAGTSIDEYTSTIILGCIQTFAGVIAVSVVDRAGRRFLLLVSEVAMVLSLTFLGLFFFLKDSDPLEGQGALGWLPLTTLATYVLAYSVGLGPVGYTIMGEILPLQVKGVAGCVLTSAKWLASFAVTKWFVTSGATFGVGQTFWGFAVICALGGVFVFLFVPETKGRSLEEIQRQFQRRLSIVQPEPTRKGEKTPLLASFPPRGLKYDLTI